MLHTFSGRDHEVITAVCIILESKKVHFTETTTVTFGNLSAETINAYVDSGDPFNKAGAYGYQSFGGILVEKINGCFYNVVGFPIYSVLQQLEKLV